MTSYNNANRLRHQAGQRSGTPGADRDGDRDGDTSRDTSMQDDPSGKDSRLKMKIAMLKDVSITIGDEIRDQNTFLASMGDDMESMGGRLATTMKHFYDMWARQGCGPFFYLTLFGITIFVVLYLYLKSR